MKSRPKSTMPFDNSAFRHDVNYKRQNAPQYPFICHDIRVVPNNIGNQFIHGGSAELLDVTLTCIA